MVATTTTLAGVCLLGRLSNGNCRGSGIVRTVVDAVSNRPRPGSDGFYRPPVQSGPGVGFTPPAYRPPITTQPVPWPPVERDDRPYRPPPPPTGPPAGTSPPAPSPAPSPAAGLEGLFSNPLALVALGAGVLLLARR